MRKDKLGQYEWTAHRWENSPASLSGLEDVWSDPDATADDLLAALPDYLRSDVTYLRCQQWQRVGRKIERVTVAEVHLQGAAQ